MAQLVAKQYAKAIFQLAVEKNLIDDYFDEATFLLDSTQGDEQFVKTILHPHITSADKMNLFENIFKNKVSDDFLGLFDVMLRKNRENEIFNVLQYFLGLVHEHKGAIVATVQTAVPLSDDQKSRIASSLEKSLSKKVDVVSEILPQLIGGMCIRVDGRILDVSVRKQFDEMKKLLKGV